MKLRDTLFLILLSVLSGLNRYIFLKTSNFSIDADEAIVGLMGKHFIEGGNVSVFYYGQHYMGSLEAILAGLSFSTLGISSFTLKLVPFLFSIFFIWCVFVLTNRIYGRAPAWIAAILCAFPAQILVDWGAKARGGFIEIVVLGALSTILFLEWFETRKLKKLFLCGFILGVGWWWNNQIIFFVTALGIYGIFSLKKNEFLKTGFTALTSFLIGGLPFWAYNIKHNFISFKTFSETAGGKFLTQAEGFFTHSIPMLAGVKRFYHDLDLIPYGSIALLVIVLLILYRVIKDSKKGLILLLIFLATFLIFSASSFGHLYKAPRYILPLYVAWFPFLGVGIYLWWVRSKIIGACLFVILIGFQLSSVYLGGITVPGEPLAYKKDRVVRDSSELLEFLDKNKIHFVRTYYWVGYKIAFESKEKVRFYPFGDPVSFRIDSYKDEGIDLGLETLPIIVTPSQAKQVEESLSILKIASKREDLNGYTVFYDLKADNRINQSFPLTLSATHNEAELSNLTDRNDQTRWGTKAAQKTGMALRLKLDSPRTVCALRLDLDRWETDLPVGVEIEGKLGDQKVSLIKAHLFQGLYPILRSSRGGVLFFEPVLVDKIILTVKTPFPPFDWSFSEIEAGC